MAIVKPIEMDFKNDNIIMIISGLPGVGKSTVAFSAPGVVLIDMDKGVKRVAPEHRKDTIISNSYEELLEDIKTPEFMSYRTAVIDTTGAFIETLKDWAMRNNPSANKKGGGISQQGFGIVKSEFLRFSAELKKTHNVIYIFHTSKSKDKDGNFIYDLMCEGAAREVVWQPADLGAYMQIIGSDRYLCFTPTQEYSAKSSYGIKGLIKVPELQPGEPNDFITVLFNQVKKNMAKENAEFAEQKKLYDEVMQKGLEIIETIIDPDTTLKAVNEIKALKHQLTSEKELQAKLKAKMAECNITYSRDKGYEQK